MFGAALSTLPRAAILHAAESARLQRLVQQHGKRVGAARFVAGETLDECVGVLRKLNDAGLPRAFDSVLSTAVDPRAPPPSDLDAWGLLPGERLKPID